MGLLLALDQGNYSLKIALFDSKRIVGRWRQEGARPEEALRTIALELALASVSSAGARFSKKDRAHLLRTIRGSVMFHSAVLSSVDPRRTKGITRALDAMGVSRVLELSARIEFPFDILVTGRSKAGPDRLAAAAGVVAAGKREGIIVDAGTAVTVDVLSKKGFLGGAILPGKDLMYRALHEGTSALPLVSDAGRTTNPPGGNTREAILSGVRWGTVGAVKELVERSRRHVSKDARVWVTGGGGAAIARHLGAGVRYERDLVFLGLRSLFELNCR
jgi:type III pantothenate kinase